LGEKIKIKNYEMIFDFDFFLEPICQIRSAGFSLPKGTQALACTPYLANKHLAGARHGHGGNG
jgi:hypothetical protein